MTDLSTRFFDFLTRTFRRSPAVASAFIVDWDGTGEKWLCERRSLRIIYNNPRRWYAVAWQQGGRTPPRILVPINKTGRVGAGKAFGSSGSKVFNSEFEWPKYFWVAYDPIRRADAYDTTKYQTLPARP